MPRHAAGLSVLPDFGFGLNYTKYVGHVGAYAGYAHNLKVFTRNRFDNSQKISAGLVVLFFNRITKYPGFLTAGASYNTYSGVIPFYAANKRAMQPYDVQIGGGAILDRVAIGVRYDVIRNDMSVDLKINFGRQIIK